MLLQRKKVEEKIGQKDVLNMSLKERAKILSEFVLTLFSKEIEDLPTPIFLESNNLLDRNLFNP